VACYLARGLQVLITVFCAKAAFLSLGSDDFVLDLLSVTGVLTITSVIPS